MTRIVPVALALSLWFGAALSAQQAGHAAIRASIELEAARLASSLAAADQAMSKEAATKQADKVAKERRNERLNERVRITASHGLKIVGWIEHLDPETLTLISEDGPVVPIPLQSITRMERTNGKRSRFWAGVLGLMVGGVGGGFLGYQMGGDCRGGVVYTWQEFSDGLSCSIGKEIGTVVIGTLGGLTGGLVGALLPNQKWSSIPLSSAAVAR